MKLFEKEKEDIRNYFSNIAKEQSDTMIKVIDEIASTMPDTNRDDTIKVLTNTILNAVKVASDRILLEMSSLKDAKEHK